MASLTASSTQAAALMLIEHGVSSLDRETVAALKKTLTPSAQKPRAPAKKSIERADAPFDKTKCCARVFVLACHPCADGQKPIPLYRSDKQTDEDGQKTEVHIGIENVQCSRNINSDGLCSLHADTTRFSNGYRCTQTGELHLGLYNQEKPQK